MPILDLFGMVDEEGEGSSAQVGGGPNSKEKYVLEDWEGAPESFVCQEQK